MPGEPRRYFPVPLRVELQRPSGEWSVEYALNLSSGGLCLHLRDPLSVGEIVRVAFEIPSGGPKLEVRARVAWVANDGEQGSPRHFCEMGLAFKGLARVQYEQLRRFAS